MNSSNVRKPGKFTWKDVYNSRETPDFLTRNEPAMEKEEPTFEEYLESLGGNQRILAELKDQLTRNEAITSELVQQLKKAYAYLKSDSVMDNESLKEMEALITKAEQLKPE